MRNRGSLMLMEMLLMMLVFAMAAAFCIQIFIKANDISTRIGERDRAVFLAQNAAEVLKDCGGDMDKAEDMLALLSEEEYLLEICRQEGVLPGLGQARIIVRSKQVPEETVFELTVAWQEGL